MKKDKNIDELFRDKLLNYEQSPPAYILDNVLAGVAGARRNRKIIFWRVAGVAAALLLAFIAGWQINMHNDVITEPVVTNSRQNVAEKPIEVLPEVNMAESKSPVETQISESVMKSGTVNFQVAELSKENQISRIHTNSENAKVTNPKPIQLNQANESLVVAANGGSGMLEPIKSLFRQISLGTTNNDRKLKKLKSEDLLVVNHDKTIDQQIMEQNKQLMQAENQTKAKSRWLIGAQVSPEYNVSRSSHSQVYASNMLNASSNPVDLGGGISVEFKKGKRWSIQSGVYYSGMGQSSGNSNLTPGKDYALASTNRGSEYFNTNVSFDASNSKMLMNSTAGVIEFKTIPSGIVLGTNLEDKSLVSNAVVVSNARFIQNFEYIEIPLYLRYTLLDSKFDVEMMGGFSSNLLVGNQTFMESSTGKSKIGSTKDMESMSYSGTLGVGLKYGLSKRVYLNVEPRVKYFLNSLNSNASVNYKPYTVGVFTGLSYEF